MSWRSRRTVILKATFSLGRDGELEAVEPRPLVLDVASQLCA